MFRLKHVLVPLLALVCMVAGSGYASAQEPSSGEATPNQSSAPAVDPNTQLVATIVVTKESAKRIPVASTLASTDASTMATGCWTQRWTGRAKAAAGNTLYTYYTVGGWCSSGSRVTSAWLADAGGETSTPGWRYEGVIRRGAGVVSNQGRSYAQQKFVLGVGGWDIQSPTPCLRVEGRYTATSTASYTCGIY